MWFTGKFLFAGMMMLFWFQSSPPNSAGAAKTAATTSQAKTAADTTAKVGTDQPVITVHGACDASQHTAPADASACTTTITREQFENLVTALNPSGQELPANARRQLAKTYAEYLAIEAAARKAGMEDAPQFRELMNWTRLRAITDFYRRKLQEKYATPAQEEIDAYYRQHSADYERVDLVRILVPRENRAAPNQQEFEKKAHDAAEAARERLAKGSDPLQIQKDAYTALGLAAPPHPALGERRRTDMLPEEAAEVFALKVGEVSQVEAEPGSYVVYKVAGKSMQPEEQVKSDISRAIVQQKFKDAMTAVLNAAPADLDEQYLQPVKATPDAVTPAPISPPSPR